MKLVYGPTAALRVALRAAARTGPPTERELLSLTTEILGPDRFNLTRAHRALRRAINQGVVVRLPDGRLKAAEVDQ